MEKKAAFHIRCALLYSALAIVLLVRLFAAPVTIATPLSFVIVIARAIEKRWEREI